MQFEYICTLGLSTFFWIIPALCGVYGIPGFDWTSRWPLLILIYLRLLQYFFVVPSFLLNKRLCKITRDKQLNFSLKLVKDKLRAPQLYWLEAKPFEVVVIMRHIRKIFYFKFWKFSFSTKILITAKINNDNSYWLWLARVRGLTNIIQVSIST